MIITLTLSLILMTFVLVKEIGQMGSGKKQLDGHTVMRLILYAVFLFLEITLILFTHTHINYVLVNTTTL